MVSDQGMDSFGLEIKERHFHMELNSWYVYLETHLLCLLICNQQDLNELIKDIPLPTVSTMVFNL